MKLAAALVLALFLATTMATPDRLPCDRAMDGSENIMFVTPETDKDDRAIDTVGGVTCSGILKTGKEYDVATTVPDGFQFALEADGAGAVFSTAHPEGCSSRTVGSGTDKVTFGEVGSVTMRLMAASGKGENVGAAPVCTFTVNSEGDCDDYCTEATIADKCNHFGGVKDDCMTWCAQYETASLQGLFTDTTGDTIGCRQYHVKLANEGDQDAMGTHCPHAGPGGGDQCGSYCDVYCGVQNNATCASNYATLADCTTACAAIAVDGEFDATSGDNIQCRLNHLVLASADADTHCPHADADGTGVCAVKGDCDLYCDMATMANCNHFDGDKDKCMAWCAQYEDAGLLGEFASIGGVDTIGCRQRHIKLANDGGQDEIDLHCPHASPGGGGECGSYCDVYCGVQNDANCATNYATLADCTTACFAMAHDGAFDATSGDTIQCRLNHLALAGISNSDIHCPHADEDGTEVCTNAGDCDQYCADAIDTCNHFGGDMDDCKAWCTQYADADLLGMFDDEAGVDTVGCRQRHVGLAIAGGDQAAKDTHCPHASPGGGGVCGTACAVYCKQMSLICPDQTFKDMTTDASIDCAAACADMPTVTDFAVTSGDSVQCRLSHIALASADAAAATTHCPHAAQEATANCVAPGSTTTTEPAEDTTAASVDTTPTPGNVVMKATMTLVGMTKNTFTAEAQAAFIEELATLLNKLISDITITGTTDVSRRRVRMLLAAGLKVDYEVAGYASEAEATTAQATAKEGAAALVTALQAKPEFADLTGIEVPDLDISGSAPAMVSWTLLLACVSAALAKYL